MYLNLRYHDDHVASNNAALSSLRRNNRHPSFAFPRTKLVLRRYEMFKPYLVHSLLPSLLSHSQWTRALGTAAHEAAGAPAAAVIANQMGKNVEAEEDKLL